MALEDQFQRREIADLKFRGAVLLMRWLLLLAYVVFAEAGVLKVSDQALLLSGGFIFVYDVFLTWQFFRGPESDRVAWFIRHVDILTTTSVIVALHDVRSPVWAVYFISIVSLAHLLTRREMVSYVVWVNINYAGAGLATMALGYDVSWPYIVAVSVILQFMGFNAAILAGGEERLRSLIAEVAVTDSLTGLPNRRRFHDAYEASIAEAIQQGIPLGLMLIDVDHFKEINDRDGHPAGDDKLREVADAMRSVVRGTDLVARYGGDEFVILAPDATRGTALTLAERLRSAAGGCDASVSIGVAIFPEDAKTQEELIEAADTALYKAKQAGRNCVRDAIAAA